MKINLNLNFFEVLTIILVVGKLSDNLGWSWAAVFSPVVASATYDILIWNYYIAAKKVFESRDKK